MADLPRQTLFATLGHHPVSPMQAKSNFNALTDAATVAVDFSISNNHKVTLGGNRTFTFSNPHEEVYCAITQDATGSRTAAWPATVVWAGGTAPDAHRYGRVHRRHLLPLRRCQIPRRGDHQELRLVRTPLSSTEERDEGFRPPLGPLPAYPIPPTMMQYFATDSRPFEDFNIKIKSGQVYDFAPEMAASLNGLALGILVEFVPAKHRPEPKVEAAVEEGKPEVAEPPKEESKEEKKVVKAEKSAK